MMSRFGLMSYFCIVCYATQAIFSGPLNKTVAHDSDKANITPAMRQTSMTPHPAHISNSSFPSALLKTDVPINSLCEPNLPVYTDIHSSSGNFTSPLYPSPYPNMASYIWRLTVERGLRISLTLDPVLLENSNPCVDYVEVRDGASKEAKLLSRVCGANRAPVVLRSSGNKLWVMFRSDCSVVYEGFQAVYTSFNEHNERTCPGSPPPPEENKCKMNNRTRPVQS
ncbi:bone morphogenetic protein 1 isoform X2 [Nematostella vectensis]|uniref:bone morphogenetic protein 1 isoform X2 n=1 Tax=Nematostella vectensis TaxID=45351 RepID=UPI0020777002|nr:bone morphogenetic protein 1 isoform X2 [Nematostella vectensis]